MMKKTVVPLLFYDILRGLKALCARSYQRSYYLICIYCGFYGPGMNLSSAVDENLRRTFVC